MESGSPNVVLLAGPNGAGKSTAAPHLLKGELHVTEFVNADTIAQGLSAYAPETAAMNAGRVMLGRLRDLAARRVDFAFETTLASRAFAPWLATLTASGYRFHLVYLWLPAPELAVSRVRERRQAGGHDVPEETVRRRYAAGLRNFFALYRPLAHTWRFYENLARPVLLAQGSAAGAQVYDPARWSTLEVTHGTAGR